MAMIVAHEGYREHGKYKAAKPGKSQSLEYGDPSWIGWYFQFSVFELSANRPLLTEYRYTNRSATRPLPDFGLDTKSDWRVIVIK